jgi:ribosome biogenesis GTPase
VKSVTKIGTVIAHQGVKVLVRTENEEVAFSIKRRSDLVVGDDVKIENDRPIGLARRNFLKRQTPYGPQNIAANLGGVGIVVAQMPPTPRLFIDQVIVAARKENITPFLIINKSDMATSVQFMEALSKEFSPELTIIPVSAKKELGIEKLREHIRNLGRCVLVGVSGVGKSSLLNSLAGGVLQKTGATVDKDRHGAHTTSQAVLYTLPDGGELIDSPGLRDFAPPDLLPGDVAHFFLGFSKLLQEPCRFNNCLHDTEPGCVIKEALKAGLISQSRYENYLELLSAAKQSAETKR